MMDRKLIPISFDKPEVNLGKGGTFQIVLPPDVHPETASLVLDVYNLDNPTHPHEHAGWWQYPLSRLSSSPHGRISVNKGRVLVALDGIEATTSWCNEQPVAAARYVIIAVLRSNATNAILAITKTPVLTDDADISRFRKTYQNDPRVSYAVSSYIPPVGQTLRIVAPNIFPRDAVGNLCLDFFYACQQNGIAAEIYADNFPLELNHIIRNVRYLPQDVVKGDRLFYFFSTYDPALVEIKALPWGRKIGYYHGVTPPRLLQVFDPELAAACGKALKQIPLLDDFDVLAANSHASVDELFAKLPQDATSKAQDVQILPPKLIASASSTGKAAAKKNKNVFLYVGRVKAHKKIEDVLCLFAAYRQLHADAECWIVGGGGDKAYLDYLAWHERENLGLPAGAVHWMGSIDDEALASAYATASLYVTMSEHEGFCLPVLEAMRARLPVFAYNIPAITEVLGGSGICFDDKSDFNYLARMIDSLLGDPKRREACLDRQQEQVDRMARLMDGNGYFRLLNPKQTKN